MPQLEAASTRVRIPPPPRGLRNLSPVGGDATEAVATARETGNDNSLADALNTLAWTWHLHGRDGEARAMAEESVTIERRLGHALQLAGSLHTLGEIVRSQGQLEEANDLYREGLSCGPPGLLTTPLLEGMAALAGSEGRFDRAARLYGAAQRIRESEGSPLSRQERALYDRDVAKARADDAEMFEEAWNEGREMSSEEAIGYALEARETTP